MERLKIKGKFSDSKKIFPVIEFKTKKFYRKYCGRISYDTTAIVIQETENAVLLRIHNGNCYSPNSQWIARSNIISLREIATWNKRNGEIKSNTFNRENRAAIIFIIKILLGLIGISAEIRVGLGEVKLAITNAYY